MADPELPETVKIMQFAEMRLEEMKTVSAALETKRGGKRIFQTLPRNLRRRAMSYNVKRMPKRLRDVHQAELDNQGRKSPSKRPSRKYRRRPTELLKEYNRRKKNNIWLETHIWHAKRFKMKNEWGYRIPLQLTTKTQRADYRAVVKGCITQDISYFNCIELQGQQNVIQEGLGKLTNPHYGITFNSCSFINGDREGQTFLYSIGKYPLGAIGPASFLWKPVDDGKRQLWIWFHPTMHDLVIEELCKAFSFELSSEENGFEVSSNKKMKMDVEFVCSEEGTSKRSLSNLMNTSDIPVYKSRNVDVKMIDLKDSLIRFKLYGPQSTRVLGSTIRSSNKQTTPQDQMWEKIVSNEMLTQLPPNFVLGLVVKDPRLFFPGKKTSLFAPVHKEKNNETTESSSSKSLEFSVGLSTSLIWNQKIRDDVTLNKQPDMKINQLRSELLIPGTPLDLGENESKIPIILIYNPGNRQSSSCALNFGAGWDIILPAGWAMPFWISLIYYGAHPAGLQFARMISDNQRIPFFPNDFPDTFAGKECNNQEEKELFEKDLKRPPAKRNNYTALKIVSPFSFPWKSLINNYQDVVESDDEFEDFFVLRNRKELKKIDAIIKRKNVDREWDIPLSLLCVRMELIHKGTVDRFALICLPNEQDLIAFKSKQFSSIDETPQPIKKSFPSQKQIFQKCRQKRKKLRAKIKTEKDADKIRQLEDKIAKYQPKVQLPNYSNCDDVINSCSRTVIGFVTSSQLMLSVSRVHAIGYCVSEGLRSIINNSDNDNLVLLRSTASLHYVFAKISLVLPD